MASQNNDFYYPYFQPPPNHPSHPPPPPPLPPHPLPPPIPVVPPSPSPDNHHPTVIIIVVVSFGCLFLLGAILFGICCLAKRHRMEKKMVQKTEDIDVDEHLKVQEMVVTGPHGPKTVVLAVEDDVHVHDHVRKNEIDMVGKGLNAESKAIEGITGDAGCGGSSQKLRHEPEHQL